MPISKSDQGRILHLEWAVRSRAQNQQCAVRLLRLFVEYDDLWKTQKWSRAAQDLLSISFSLWRAAFLADKNTTRSEVFSHAKNFLEKIIEDNAISYPNDRMCKNWTFNYYTRNARACLNSLAEYWSDQVPAFEGKKRTPTERWEYCQTLLETAVKNFEVKARELQSRADATIKGKATRLAAEARKRKSRSMTQATRQNAKTEDRTK